jgi:ATP-dependent Lon protease
MVEGEARGKLHAITQTVPFLLAQVEALPPTEHDAKNSARTEALIRRAYDLFESYAELAPRMSPEVLVRVLASNDPGYIADYIAQNIVMRAGDKQAILEELNPVRRLDRMIHIHPQGAGDPELEQEMQNKVRDHLTRSQRDYFLREQLKVIQGELARGKAERTAKLPNTARPLPKQSFQRRLPTSSPRRWQGWKNSRLAPPRPQSSAIIWIFAWNCRGTGRPVNGWTWPPRARCSMPTITAWKR